MKMPNMIATWILFDFGYKYMKKKRLATGIQWYADGDEAQAWHKKGRTWVKNRDLVENWDDKDDARPVVEKVMDSLRQGGLI